MRSYTEQLQDINNKYTQSGEPWPATLRQIAAWAVANGLWTPQPASVIGQCGEELGRAMREEYITDPQGRTVRAKHSARIQVDGKQQSFWNDIRTASRVHMAIAFQNRRNQVLGECRQLKTDVDSYNDNAHPAEPIQMVLDFSQDLAEEAVIRRSSRASIGTSQQRAQSPIGARL